VVSERESQEQFEELSLLQARGFKLCLTIVGLPRLSNHLLVGMWATTLRHTKMAGELAVLPAVVSSAMESMLGRSLVDNF
jgi:hypothetical protein